MARSPAVAFHHPRSKNNSIRIGNIVKMKWLTSSEIGRGLRKRLLTGGMDHLGLENNCVSILMS